MSRPLDTADIAELLGVSREYATDRVVKRPDFPPPVLRLTQRVVRWDEAAVRRWIEAQQVKASRQSPPPRRGNTAAASGHPGDR